MTSMLNAMHDAPIAGPRDGSYRRIPTKKYPKVLGLVVHKDADGLRDLLPQPFLCICRRPAPQPHNGRLAQTKQKSCDRPPTPQQSKQVGELPEEPPHDDGGWPE